MGHGRLGSSPTSPATPADRHPAWEWGTQTYDTGTYDATAWNTGATPDDPATQNRVSLVRTPVGPATRPPFASHDGRDASTAHRNARLPRPHDYAGTAEDGFVQTDPRRRSKPTVSPTLPRTTGGVRVRAASAAGPFRRPARRRCRRRTPAKRSALLTVAVPSACVMGVAGIAAASVSGVGGGEETKDDDRVHGGRRPVKPAVANNKLDTQLANLSADADNFADRASRTQERIDLKEQQAAEKKKRAEEAAREERRAPSSCCPSSSTASAPSTARPA